MRAFAALILATLLVGCQEQSVKPGINQPYYDEVSAETWTKRFEVESREIFTRRNEIVQAMGLKRGDRVADVGAGTGLFVPLLSGVVGPKGRVVAQDIQPYFLEHIRRRAAEEQLTNVETILGEERSANLHPASVNVILLCDVYHHFEYPRSMLASLHEALTTQGRLFVVDFHRIEGVSREWVLGHVRAGEEVVTAEIESAGFRRIARHKILEENWCSVFERIP